MVAVELSAMPRSPVETAARQSLDFARAVSTRRGFAFRLGAATIAGRGAERHDGRRILGLRGRGAGVRDVLHEDHDSAPRRRDHE